MPLIQFKSHFRLEIIDCEQLVLFSEDKHHLLQGSVYVEIAKLIISNPISEETIIKNLLPKFPLKLLQEAFSRLRKKGFLTDFCNKIEKNILAFWSDLSLDEVKGKKTSIAIKNFSQNNVLDLITALEKLSLKVTEFGDFFIVLVDNYICHELEEFNLARLHDKKPWMLLKPSGRIIWIGPIFESNRTGCWNCLAEKIKENRRVEVDLFGLNNSNLNISALAHLPNIWTIAMNMAALEVAKWEKSPQSHQLHKNLLTFDLKNMQSRLHPFKKQFTCKACRTLDKSINKLYINLKSSPKKIFLDEGERSCSLDDTLQNLSDYISPITGIISNIRHAIVNDEHVCYTVRTLPLPDKHVFEDRYLRIPDVATGKGQTKLQATVGCIAEAIERYNCTFTTQKEIRCTYEEIKHEAIHPHTLLNFSELQYNNREKINALRTGFNKIPEPYNGSKIGWTAVFSMIHKRICYIPSSYCYLSYPNENDVKMCPGNSNGCASGNTLEEAFFYAFLELVERDAVAIWWYNRIKRPQVNLSIFNDYSLTQILHNFKKNDRELFILDITTDLQIPCYVAVSWKSDGSQIFFGTGCHLEPRIGIARAISELNQIMIRANTPKNIDLNSVAAIERDLVKWSINESIDDHPYLVPESICNPQKRHAPSNDFLTDINLCIEIFKKMGYDILFFDLTNPNIPFHTARVVIPGLRHFWSRLAPGRLYDAPVRLGWLQKSLTESEMNPIPYFL
ncbi:bacteriocin biosynthesis docking SCAFFOLD, SagD family [Candidatus Rubidus massiliensis]|nr:bacteriocin biosynthesis docking SCAFFOLD, SagD family [Candidatus Rubidus massiliensis]